MTQFADLADLPEDERIRIIADRAKTSVVGFFVDDDEKADRYIKKLGNRVRVIDRHSNTPIRGTVFVKVGPRSE